MQFEHSKLKGKIKEKGFTQEEIAKHIKIAPSTFSIKINSGMYFNQEEICGMANLLEIPEKEYKKYFFSLKV